MPRRGPIFDGHTYIRAGSIRTGKIVIYPIVDNIDEQGNQLINWMADTKGDTFEQNDWNQPGNLADFLPVYESWHFDWLDVPKMIRESEQVLEYLMVDEDLVGDKPFENLDSYISQDELRTLSENYKRVAGFTLADVVSARTGT